MAKTKTETKSKPWQDKLTIGLIIATIVMIGLTVLMYNIAKADKESQKAYDPEMYIKQTPKLVFKTINFYKYVIYGKADGTNKWLDKLDVFHLAGSADLYINLKDNFEIDTTKTDRQNKELYLIFKGESEFPICVDVNIPDENIVKVERIEPYVLPDEEAKEIADSVSKITKQIGSLVVGYYAAKYGIELGDKAGEALSKSIPNPIVKNASKILGPIIGGALGAVCGSNYGGEIGEKWGYVITEKLLTGFHLADGHPQGDDEQFLKTAKALIAVELAGGDVVTNSEVVKLQERYQKECKNAIETVMKGFGWETIYVEFKNE
ncbi:MAG: hypothetical protein IKP73_01090 [Bacteroidales bacterium]|nr:hypothetical protein [Bacteroidales bacterium]